jgi:hypothetical protein
LRFGGFDIRSGNNSLVAEREEPVAIAVASPKTALASLTTLVFSGSTLSSSPVSARPSRARLATMRRRLAVAQLELTFLNLSEQISFSDLRANIDENAIHPPHDFCAQDRAILCGKIAGAVDGFLDGQFAGGDGAHGAWRGLLRGGFIGAWRAGAKLARSSAAKMAKSLCFTQ